MRAYSRLFLACLMVSAGMMASCETSQPGKPSSSQGSALSSGKTPAKDVTAGSAATEPAASVSEVLLNEPDRRVFRMSNGFSVILQQNKTAPVVAARVYIKAGALTEQQYMAAGISHVLEHLVAGASSGKRKEEENTLLLMQIGNDSNAYTDADHTCYFVTTTADKWPVAMDLLIDFTTNTSFTREQFDREYKVVQRELEMDEAEAERIFYTHTQANRYLEHPARHPAVGYKSAFQKLTFEDCKAYYQQMYVPDNMIISVAGDIDLDAAEKLIVGQLKDIKRKTVPAITLPEEPAVAAPRNSVSRADVRQARIEWAFPTTTMYSPDMYPMDVLANVLGGNESSLLVRRLRDELGLVVAINCSDPTPRYAEGELEITAVLAPEKIPAAQEALLGVLDNVVKNGVPTDAIERAKAQAVAEMVYGNQTAEQQASRNALDFMATGNIDFTELYVKRLQAVTPADVLAAARKYLQTDRLLTTTLLPLNAKDPWAGVATTKAAENSVSVRKTVLKNGVTVLISRNSAAPLGSFHIYTLGGLLAEDDASNGIGNAMMQLMTRGTDSRSHEQIAEFLDSTGTTLSAESGSNSFSLSMQCMKDKAGDAFNLFADVALHPKFAQGELEQVRPLLLSAVEQATEDWFEEAYKVTKETYFASSPYKRLPVGKADVISKLTSEAIRKHYDNYFLDPQKMVLAISGDIDPDAALKWAAQFENIPSHSPALNLTSTPASPTTLTKHTEKQSATVMLAYPPGIKITNPDRHALIVLQAYLGGYTSQSGSVLFDTLRGKGLVYTVQASNISGPASGMFLISALGEPQNAQEIVRNIQEIVERTKQGNIPDALLAACKDQAITGEKLSKQTIADKSGSQALDELLGLGYDDDMKFPERIRVVTKADVVRVANRYLMAPIVVILSPDAKK